MTAEVTGVRPDRITADTPDGEVFAGRPKTLSFERLWTFSGGPFAADGWPRKNLHTDPAVAESLGLPSVAASGTQYQGHVIELLIDLFGEEWLSHGTMTAKFIGIVNGGDTVQSRVAVRSRQGQGSVETFTLDVWCENQHGTKVLVGEATGRVGR